LAENLNVSITPVREALRDLVAQGLVHEDPFRGATVHEVSLEELEEVYQLRCLLLPIAIRDRVATISDEQLTVAERMARAMDVEMDDQAWVDANRDFHRALDATSDRLPHLQMILSRLADISALYIALSITSNRARRQRACKDHLALVKAYRARDADRAVEIAIRHFEDTASAARTYLAERETAVPQ
jgi:DNA-binding GntR family transcriptional regulator